MPTLEEVLKRAGVNPFIFMYLPTIQKIIDAAQAAQEQELKLERDSQYLGLLSRRNGV